MALKQITLAVNDYCNNRCDVMCKIYKNKPVIKTSPSEFEVMLEKPEFKELVEVSLTGGEPFMSLERVSEIMNILISELPKLEWVFVNTNGT